MRNTLRGQDFINLRDLTPDQFRYLLDLAHTLKAEKRAGVDQRRFVGKNVMAQFEWSSTRTRCAFETSCNDLGIGFTYLSNSHVGDVGLNLPASRLLVRKLHKRDNLVVELLAC